MTGAKDEPFWSPAHADHPIAIRHGYYIPNSIMPVRRPRLAGDHGWGCQPAVLICPHMKTQNASLVSQYGTPTVKPLAGQNHARPGRGEP
ncbi:MAG: hypothetical protein ACOYMG_25970 [Candidatus Methylumidiphilus sp.]